MSPSSSSSASRRCLHPTLPAPGACVGSEGLPRLLSGTGEPVHSLSPQCIRTPSLLTSLALIFALKIALSSCGYGRVMRWIRRQMIAVQADESMLPEVVRASERAVALAGALFPGRALCLEQSLVLYYMLRRRGVAVRYCHGVIARPFQAHAWIEYRAEVVNDVPEHARQFQRLPDQLP